MINWAPEGSLRQGPGRSPGTGAGSARAPQGLFSRRRDGPSIRPLPIFFAATALLTAGCADDGEAYMPLGPSKTWSYLVDDGVNKMPDHVRVTRRIPVGDALGYELTGELGTSHFAWLNGRLISDELSNTRFLPPLCILATRERTIHWRGWVFSGDKKQPASADIDYVKAKKDETSSADTIDSTVRMKIDKQHVTLVTRFESDYGIVKQEQRTDDQLSLSLTALSKS